MFSAGLVFGFLESPHLKGIGILGWGPRETPQVLLPHTQRFGGVECELQQATLTQNKTYPISVYSLLYLDTHEVRLHTPNTQGQAIYSKSKIQNVLDCSSEQQSVFEVQKLLKVRKF